MEAGKIDSLQVQLACFLRPKIDTQLLLQLPSGRRRMMRHFKFGMILVLLLVSGISVYGVWAQTEGDVERGGQLYVENCAMCHGVEGKGRIGANLNEFPGIQVDETLAVTIRRGIAGSPMPAWGEAFGGPFSEEDITDVAAYIQAAFVGTEPIQPLPEYIPPDIPALPAIDGDPAAGAAVYQAECKACHGEAGRGRIGPVLAKSWTGIDPYVYIRNVVNEGIRGSTMPAWLQENGGPLSDSQVANVSAYVLSLDPAMQTDPEPTIQEGPLNLTISLVLIGALGAALIVGLILYYRRA